MELVRPVPPSEPVQHQPAYELELVAGRSALASARLRRSLTVEEAAKRAGLPPDQV